MKKFADVFHWWEFFKQTLMCQTYFKYQHELQWMMKYKANQLDSNKDIKALGW
jgi:hypothetical protein